jgi:hypothetical protein
MEFLSDFLAWAWARHHNVLSWYIRPLFILPYIYFAYKQSWKGLVVTVIALATSMFWSLPLKPWTRWWSSSCKRSVIICSAHGVWEKLLLTLTVPAFFYFLALAFWKRSWWWGVAVINLAALGKIAWSVTEGGESGWAILVPAVIGMLICNVAVYFGVKFINRRTAKFSGA